eukprot:TRINITY_DN11861_c0_g1_i1.p1 TRINITY_DN11861_c0_g1~~TRINITY_DN11861_c0_g1_i1.p1  ORF type:complete len:248 (+),score=25.28 TRINITY_DN11861_c0_g1_i1:81-824(+)
MQLREVESAHRCMGFASKAWFLILLVAIEAVWTVDAGDKNTVFSPCTDATVQKGDGFTFGLGFAANESFYADSSLQISPCNKSFTSGKIALFRPKVDEITLMTINHTDLTPQDGYGYVVAFSGAQVAATSYTKFVANQSHIVSSLTLVLDFDKGRLKKYLWKNDGCKACQKENSSLVCINGEDCAIPTESCGTVDCSLNVQLTFSGVDKHDSVLNSWYQVKNIRQYSLYSLYDSLKSSLTSQYFPWS